MSYDLVLFDFDGTLADSAAWFRRVINGVAARYHFRPVAEHEFEALRGQDNRAIIRHLGVPSWKMPLIANHMRRLMSRDLDTIALFPGVPSLLRALVEEGATLAVVSSNTEENVRAVLGPDAAELIRYYACGASLFGKAAKFRQVLKASRVPADRALAVGDEARDIEAARAAGVAAGAVAWGYATPEFLRSREPTIMFDSFEAIVAAVAGGPAASRAAA
ncbi:MAG TPA: HAD hydrolase-like protein [Beijerinckiaceae bacterium]|jgi:phosphoglycolate phosphatase